MRTIGQRIRAARDAAGLTRMGLAVRLGLGSESTVKRWERDECYPPVKNMAALAEALGVSVASLMEASE